MKLLTIAAVAALTASPAFAGEGFRDYLNSLDDSAALSSLTDDSEARGAIGAAMGVEVDPSAPGMRLGVGIGTTEGGSVAGAVKLGGSIFNGVGLSVGAGATPDGAYSAGAGLVFGLGGE